MIHRPRVQPRSDLKSREVTRQNKHYLPPQTSPIYHPIYHYNTEVNFSEGQLYKEIETIFPYQEEAIKHEYTRPNKNTIGTVQIQNREPIPVKWYINSYQKQWISISLSYL